MSSPPDARPYQGTIAPNEIRGSGQISRAEIISRDREAAIRARNAEAESKRQAEIVKLENQARQAARRRHKKRSQVPQESEAPSVDVFTTYKQLKVEGKAKGIDINQATIKENRTTGQVKVRAKGLESKEAREKRENRETKAIVDRTLADLKTKGANLNGANIKVGKIPYTDQYEVKASGFSLPSEKTKAPVEMPKVNYAYDVNLVEQLGSGNVKFAGQKGIDIEAGKPGVYVGKDEYGNEYKTIISEQVTSVKRESKEFKPDIGQQVYRGTVTYGAEFESGVAKLFNYAPGVSEKQKRQGEENLRQFTEKFGVDNEHPVYGGFSGLSAGAAAAVGSPQGKEQLAEANKAFKERPVEFITASAVDVGAGLIGLRGAKGFASVGSKLPNVIKNTYSTIKGSKITLNIGKGSKLTEKPYEQFKSTDYENIEDSAYTVKPKEIIAPKLTTLDRAMIKLKVGSYRLGKAFKPVKEPTAAEHLKNLPEISYERSELKVGSFEEYQAKQAARNLKQNEIIADYEKGQSPKNLISQFAPKEPTTKGGGTFKQFKPEFGEAGKVSAGAKGRFRTLTQEVNPKEQKLFTEKLSANALKQAEKEVFKGPGPQVYKTEAKLPGLSGSRYEKPRTPLGFGGYSGLKKRRKEDELTLYLTRPPQTEQISKSNLIGKTAIDLGSMNEFKQIMKVTERPQSISGLKVESLSKNLLKSLQGGKINNSFKIGQSLKINTQQGQKQKNRLGLAFSFKLPTLTKEITTNPTPTRTQIIKEKPPKIPRIELPKFAKIKPQKPGRRERKKRKTVFRTFQVNSPLAGVLAPTQP